MSSAKASKLYGKLEHYFAFGSNMNVARVTERGLRCSLTGVASLKDFQLKFNKRSRAQPGSGRANIEQCPGKVVFGILYRLEKPEEIVRMDSFEYAPVDYRRVVVEVKCCDEYFSSWTYIARPVCVDNSLRPPQWYLNHLLAARHILPPQYVAELERVACTGESLD